jgi:hypothetical protein
MRKQHMPVCVLSQLGKPGDTAPLARKDRIGKGFMKSGVGQTKRIGGDRVGEEAHSESEKF